MDSRYKKKTIVVAMVVLVMIFLKWLDLSHWTAKDEKIDERIAFDKKIESIYEGIEVANKRAHEWKKEAVLVGVYAKFKGKKEIDDRKGEIIYKYYVKNNSFFGYPDVICRITIDLKRQEVTRFETIGGERLAEERIDPERWKLDVEDIMSLVEKSREFKQLDKYNCPQILIYMGEERTFVTLFSSLEIEAAEERIEIVIDNAKKEIVTTKVLPKLAIPR